jgi:hypothetical protein
VVNEQPEEIAWEITAADIARRYKDVVGPSRVVVLAIDVKNAIESAVAAERQRQEAARAGLVEELGRVRRAVNEVYPTVAGRVIQLEQAGETNAHAIWANIARRLFDVLEPHDALNEVAEPAGTPSAPATEQGAADGP